jgi:hypothetical protein
MQQINASRTLLPRAKIEEMLQAAFSVGPLRGYMIRPTEFSSVSECSAVEYSGGNYLVGEQSVGGPLQFSTCELLLLEAGS